MAEQKEPAEDKLIEEELPKQKLPEGGLDLLDKMFAASAAEEKAAKDKLAGAAAANMEGPEDIPRSEPSEENHSLNGTDGMNGMDFDKETFDWSQ